MIITDEDLRKEIVDYKRIAKICEKCKAPKRVVNRNKFLSEALEELLSWRDTGRKWLEEIKKTQKTKLKVKPIFLSGPTDSEITGLVHHAKDWKGVDNRIIEVICECGEVTKYKVPLRTINDFQCPKETGE